MYHYAGNNPVRYTDPTGLDIDDWQNNGDGTWTVISEGATLWDVWGVDAYNITGLTEEQAKSIHIGDTFGNKIESNPVLTGNVDMITLSQETLVQSQNPVNNSNGGCYSKTNNFFIGLGELVLGVGIIVGGGFSAAAIAPGTMGTSAMVGYGAVTTGGAIFAYGLTRMAGANNTHIGEDVKNILVPPMAAFVNMDSKEAKNHER